MGKDGRDQEQMYHIRAAWSMRTGGGLDVEGEPVRRPVLRSWRESTGHESGRPWGTPTKLGVKGVACRMGGGARAPGVAARLARRARASAARRSAPAPPRT